MRLVALGIALSSALAYADRIPRASSSSRVDIPRCSLQNLGNVEGYLLDLDGTIYDDKKLLKGAKDFMGWLEHNKKPYALLSNGNKTRRGVASKFLRGAFELSFRIRPDRVHTAAVAMADYMAENVPAGAKIFCLGTGIEYYDGTKDFITSFLERGVPAELFNTWELRTDLTPRELMEWAQAAREGETVVVAQAIEAFPSDPDGDPVTGQRGYRTLDYELAKKVTRLLRNGAFYVVGAPDVAHSNPKDPEFPEVDTAWPTTGGLEALLMNAAEMHVGNAREKQKHINVGKGGNHGVRYMMEPGMKILRKIQPEINQSNVLMVGDNFGTDLLAANQAGMKSLLVLTGAHRVEDAANWTSRPTCFLDHVGQIPEVLSPSFSPSKKRHNRSFLSSLQKA